jgi:hypothetical protein|uniref:Uncharacterized protein n=1 Tax=Zea mays TaxID=4577 RepID=C0PEP0_MAIZE|nr:unknown [Zea mays]
MPVLPREPEEGPVQRPVGAHRRRRRDRHGDAGEGEREALPQLHRQPAPDRPRQHAAGLLRLPSLARLLPPPPTLKLWKRKGVWEEDAAYKRQGLPAADHPLRIELAKRSRCRPTDDTLVGMPRRCAGFIAWWRCSL